MCDDAGGAPAAGRTVPRPAPGAAVDPIGLEPVEEVRITSLVDNLYDALLADDERTGRARFGVGTATAPQFEEGRTAVGLVAEHGFSALVTVRRGDTTTSLLFDAGMSPDALVTNADRRHDPELGHGPPVVDAVVHASR